MLYKKLLEYGDMVWSNCTKAQKDDLDKIQNEAARIVTGCTKLVSIRALHLETGWESLEERRRKHKLTLLYKMINGLTPPYLSNLLPPLVGSSNPYPLRNSDNFLTLRTNTALYYDSFLPSTTREWNSLPSTQRNATSLSSFKSSFKSSVLKSPLIYYHGSRKLQILHTRIRTNCSSLNSDLFHKNIIVSPVCAPCNMHETSFHYFFQCSRFNVERMNMMTALSTFQPITLELLLFGNNTMSYEDNTKIFDAVHTFIINTKRFS